MSRRGLLGKNTKLIKFLGLSCLCHIIINSPIWIPASFSRTKAKKHVELVTAGHADEVNTSTADGYIDKMEDTYVRAFGEKPSRRVTSPLEKGDHPELDLSEFLDGKYTKIYQSMIGAS